MTPTLSIQQRNFYDENGYIIIRNYIRTQLLDEFDQRFKDICNGDCDHNVLLIMKDQSLKKAGAKGEFVVNKIQDFAFDEVFWKYVSNDALVDVIEAIIGPNITAIHSMLINKPPNAEEWSSVHPLHQDLHYFPFKPANKIIGTWTAIQKVDEDNGCLYVVPGSHKGPLYEHAYPEGGKQTLYHGIRGFDHLNRVFLRMEKGDTIFFHPKLLHGSGPNRTKVFRRAISCHYADSNCEDVDVSGTTQDRMAREVLELAKKRGFHDISIADFWRSKSRLVRGEPGALQTVSSKM